MFDAIINKPNRVLERQKLYQASHAPLYVRGPRSRIYYGLYLIGWTAGLAGTFAGVVSLIKGKPAA